MMFSKIPAVKSRSGSVKFSHSVIKCKSCGKILTRVNANRQYCDNCR